MHKLTFLIVAIIAITIAAVQTTSAAQQNIGSTTDITLTATTAPPTSVIHQYGDTAIMDNAATQYTMNAGNTEQYTAATITASAYINGYTVTQTIWENVGAVATVMSQENTTTAITKTCTRNEATRGTVSQTIVPNIAAVSGDNLDVINSGAIRASNTLTATHVILPIATTGNGEKYTVNSSTSGGASGTTSTNTAALLWAT